MDKTAASALLGMPESEIVRVLDDDAGTVIKTFDGQSYIVVPEDNPDADGKTGLMFLAAPSATYAGGFPVFAQPTEEDDEDWPAERVTEVVPPPKPKRRPAKRVARQAAEPKAKAPVEPKAKAPAEPQPKAEA